MKIQTKLLLVVLSLSTSAFAQKTTIEISGATFKPTPIAVPAPIVQDDGARAGSRDFDEGMVYDLTACGLFQVLDRKSFLADPKEGVTGTNIDFTKWANVGADMLVKTQLSLDGDQLHGDLRLFAVNTGREELKVSDSAPMRDARRLAHKLADQVYKHLTKETGPFQTHLTWVKKNGAGKDVYVSDWDGKNAGLVVTGGINLLPTLAPDGSVAFTSYRKGKPDLWVGRVGSEPKSLVSQGRMATGIAYSPDGKRIAFALADGESSQIWVANADGSSPKMITNTNYFINTSPSWSPDGKRMAFVSNRAGTPQIYTMTADGGEVKRLTFQGNYNQTPDWSPRGDLIVFTARDERNAFDLFTIDVGSGKVVRLTQDQGNNEEGSFSPNGRLIIFTSTRSNGGSPSLFVMTFDGNNQTPLPAGGGAFSTPDWGN